MISVIITTYKEPKTIGKAIEEFLKQISKDDEIIVVSPDEETISEVEKYSKKNKNVILVRDESKGKPHALNTAFKEAKGDILILSDGDVYIRESAVEELIKPFEDKYVGAVSGHPISLSRRNTILGYWSHLLTDAAHMIRMRKQNKDKYLDCSGYLYAIRNHLIHKIPEETLAEDAYISNKIAQLGYKIKYAKDALVCVKYPKTYKDWIKQKVRSTGGYEQKHVKNDDFKMRSFSLEVVKGTLFVLLYPRSFKEFYWSILLFLARLHVWLLVAINVKLLKTPLKKIWKRVESTK